MSVSGIRTSEDHDIGALAERVADLWKNERELLWAANGELKALVRELKSAGGGIPVHHGSALHHCIW